MSVFYRAVPWELETVGRERLTGRIVPFDRSTVVVDLDEATGRPADIYTEGFRRGAFDRQVNSREKGVLARIGLVHRHEGPRGAGYFGPFIGLRNGSDGLYGDVRVLPGRADDLEALLESGVNELSVEFRLVGEDHTHVDADGVRWRSRAHLDQVALEPKGAYSGAQVLAFRSEVDDFAKAELERRQREDAEAAAAAAETARLDEERKANEAAAAAAAERRERWNALTSRVDADLEKQKQLVRDYGVTSPGGYARR
jgi:HK97 family phage prohead protease